MDDLKNKLLLGAVLLFIAIYNFSWIPDFRIGNQDITIFLDMTLMGIIVASGFYIILYAMTIIILASARIMKKLAPPIMKPPTDD